VPISSAPETDVAIPGTIATGTISEEEPAMPLAGLAVKAFPMLLDNAPTIWAAATQLVQSARRAKSEIAVDSVIPGAGVSEAALEAAMRDIEASLFTLNAQMETSAALVASLAGQNEMLAARAEKLQSWLVTLAVLSGVAIALSAAAFAIVLGR
jgi:hypothetical protein